MIRNIVIASAAMALAACSSQPAATKPEIQRHLEKQGYSKVVLQKEFSCGKMGKGRHFVGSKGDQLVTGQVCYLKTNTGVSYKVSPLSSKTKAGAPAGKAQPITALWKN